MIEVKVVGVGLEPQSNRPLVFLRDEVSKSILPIQIGYFEATAISTKLVGQEPPRPITYDLLSSILGGLDARVTDVTITELKDNTFFARIKIEYKETKLDVDSRPSDAIALALRVGARLYVAEEVMAAAGIQQSEIEKQREEEQEVEEAEPQGSSDESVDEVSALKVALKAAVEAEDFERAAGLRDRIHALEGRA